MDRAQYTHRYWLDESSCSKTTLVHRTVDDPKKQYNFWWPRWSVTLCYTFLGPVSITLLVLLLVRLYLDTKTITNYKVNLSQSKGRKRTGDLYQEVNDEEDACNSTFSVSYTYITLPWARVVFVHIYIFYRLSMDRVSSSCSASWKHTTPSSVWSFTFCSPHLTSFHETRMMIIIMRCFTRLILGQQQEKLACLPEPPSLCRSIP